MSCFDCKRMTFTDLTWRQSPLHFIVLFSSSLLRSQTVLICRKKGKACKLYKAHYNIFSLSVHLFVVMWKLSSLTWEKKIINGIIHSHKNIYGHKTTIKTIHSVFLFVPKNNKLVERGTSCLHTYSTERSKIITLRETHGDNEKLSKHIILQSC